MGDPISQVDPLGLANGPAISWMTGQKPVPPDYCSCTVSGPGFSYGLTLSRNGTLFGNIGTGGVTPGPSISCSAGVLNGGPQPPAKIDDFLNRASGQMNYGTLGLGVGNVFSGGQIATQINAGTPALPGGGAGYGVPIVNIFGRPLPQ